MKIYLVIIMVLFAVILPAQEEISSGQKKLLNKLKAYEMRMQAAVLELKAAAQEADIELAPDFLDAVKVSQKDLAKLAVTLEKPLSDAAFRTGRERYEISKLARHLIKDVGECFNEWADRLEDMEDVPEEKIKEAEKRLNKVTQKATEALQAWSETGLHAGFEKRQYALMEIVAFRHWADWIGWEQWQHNMLNWAEGFNDVPEVAKHIEQVQKVFKEMKKLHNKKMDLQQQQVKIYSQQHVLEMLGRQNREDLEKAEHTFEQMAERFEHTMQALEGILEEAEEAREEDDDERQEAEDEDQPVNADEEIF